MNKVDRHNSRVAQADKVRAAELRAAYTVYMAACTKANDKHRMTVETSQRQMEREPNG